MTQQEKRAGHRRYMRHMRTIRLRFMYAEGEHYGATTSISLSGAFVRADTVPRPGAVLLLEERFAPPGRGIAMLGEVVWSLDAPTLDRPDTGFGFRFFELSTAAGPEVIEEFLHSLEPDYRDHVDIHIVPDEGLGGVRGILHLRPLGEGEADRDVRSGRAANQRNERPNDLLDDLDPELFRDGG